MIDPLEKKRYSGKLKEKKLVSSFFFFHRWNQFSTRFLSPFLRVILDRFLKKDALVAILNSVKMN